MASRYWRIIFEDWCLSWTDYGSLCALQRGLPSGVRDRNITTFPTEYGTGYSIEFEFRTPVRMTVRTVKRAMEEITRGLSRDIRNLEVMSFKGGEVVFHRNFCAPCA